MKDNELATMAKVTGNIKTPSRIYYLHMVLTRFGKFTRAHRLDLLLVLTELKTKVGIQTQAI